MKTSRLLSLAAAGCLAASAYAQKKPHIVFIIADQHRYDALNCMGNDAVISPNIDSLAKNGTLFMSGYSSAPSSTPARAGLLTGMSPWHHGMLGYGRVANQYPFEMPQMLADQNYYTMGIGKMHWFPQKSLHGFHATLVDESGRVEGEDFISDYRLWFQTQAPGKDPDITGMGWNDHQAGIYKLPEDVHPTVWTGKMACEVIKNYPTDEKPLFLKVSFARPHSPYDPPQRLLDAYADLESPSPWVADWCRDRDYAIQVDASKAKPDASYGNFGSDYVKNTRKHYYASITFIDEEIGRIVAALKANGMYDNTLICYTSDHGDMMGDHHHWRKTYPYEGSTHIPYIVKWPETSGITKGVKVTEPVELRDFLPTFLEAAGSEIPTQMDGASLFKLVDGRKSEWRKYIDMEHATCYSPDNYWCALTDGSIKYVWRFHTGQEELFDLINDPHELTNHIGNKKYKKRVDELRAAMVEHLSERGEEFVKDGKLQVLKRTVLYSPMFPDENPVDTGI